MKAVIMAGGAGTRLRPLTSNIPKPMLPVANKPMMGHIVELLREHGFTDIVVTVAFMANHIRTYFGDGSEFGVRMVYATEEEPRGTAGSVRNAMDELDERFLVISGDVLCDIDLSKVTQTHQDKGALATIGLVPVSNPLEFGIVMTHDDGSIDRFLEKPSWGQVFSDTINSGIFVLEPEIFDHIEPGREVDFAGEVFPALLDAGEDLYGAVAEGYWEDVGTLDAYLRAHKDLLDGRVRATVDGFELSPGVWLGEGAEIDPDATVDGAAVIGPGTHIDAGARIGEYTVLGSNVRVRRDVDLERSVIHDNSYLGEGVALRGAVVGRSSDLRRRARCDDGAVLGDECFVGEGAVIGADVKVYPFKTIEAGAVVNSSIVWESRGARSLFGQGGVSGLANVDITPELASRVAMAWASTLPKGSTVITSRDSSRAARMLKRALMAGFNASGVDVSDLEVASVPVTRFLVRQPHVAAGLTARLVEDDPQSVVFRLFDGAGIDITESAQRKIERLFAREDFRRVIASEIGDIGFPPRALEHYTAALSESIDTEVVRQGDYKLVIDYGFGSTSFVLPNVLANLGAEVLGVNPFASTEGAMAFDRDRHAERVAELVRASGANLGAVIDPDGEHLRLVDDRARILDDAHTMLAMVSLVAGHLDGDRIAAPVHVSRVIEDLVRPHGVSIAYTKTDTGALMDAATEAGIGFAASTSGGFILPGFLPAFDAVAALIKLLEVLMLTGSRLSEVIDRLPETHLANEQVVTPWDQKGVVMRQLVESTQEREQVLIDGVKVFHDGGWALALPDPAEPMTQVWAEGPSDAEARRLAQEYALRIRQMIH